MKKILLLFCLYITSITTAQSISGSRLLYYVSNQNINSISKELKQLKFTSKVDNSLGFPMYQFLKGTEEVSIGRNTELFMVIYKPEYSVYEIIRDKTLTSEFQYAYSYKSTKYYENKTMRIGADDTNGIISFFKGLK